MYVSSEEARAPIKPKSERDRLGAKFSIKLSYLTHALF